MSERNLSEFINLYPLSETLTFELRPMGKTAEMFEKSGILVQDYERAEFYPKVKKILDEEHKALLNRVLSDIPVALAKLPGTVKNKYAAILTEDKNDINWLGLSGAKAAALNPDEDAKKTLENTEKIYRSLILELLKTDDLFEALTESTPAKWLKSFSGDKKEWEKELNAFSKFATYFKGFQENRKNIYSADAIATGAPNRAINENFTKFFKCVRIFKYIEKSYPEMITEAEKELADILNGYTLAQIFSVQAYSRYLAQSGISFLNNIIGGFSCADNVKIKGLNEFINLKRQNLKSNGVAKDANLVIMPLLFKQILSDRESISYIPEQIENDDELCNMIRHFLCETLVNFESGGEVKNLIHAIRALLGTLTPDENITIPASYMETISSGLTGSWSTIRYSLDRYAEDNISNKKERDKFLKKDEYSFAELNKLGLSKVDAEGNTLDLHVCDFWKGEIAEKIFAEIEKTQPAALAVLDKKSEKTLHERENDVADLKLHLDAIMELLHFIKPLCMSENTGAEQAFVGELITMYQQLEAIIPLYSKVRNYITKKNVEAPKVKLMFNNPTLADGWDLNKERDNTAVIFLKDGAYFLGIMNPKDKIDFAKAPVPDNDDDVYKKMIYKLLPGPNKMLPKVFFSQKNKDLFQPTEQLLAKYQDGQYKKGATFDLAFCHDLIDYFKDSIAKHPDWKNFGFQFSDTKSYSGIDSFYREISEQGYKITFQNISAKYVNDLVESGKLFLFQIYNKDFAPGAHGTPNKFTLYWKALFSPENLADVIFKLNGEAELFLRNPVIKEPVIHAAGSKLVNRVTRDKRPIREDLYQEIYKFVNGKSAQLSKEAKELFDSGNIVVKDARFDIVKDARYTRRQFSFHVPIAINYKAQGVSKFNSKVLEYLSGNPDVKIIGIDRGERHLLYLSLIDQQGDVLEQKSLNLIQQNNVAYNYQEKLDHREKERDQARKSWSSVGQIKDLKAGYLSAVVHEIAKMMVEHNAIVVLEDLNFGFKRGRFKIEKQVYQNFEKALIQKLNYLVFKQRKNEEPGGVLNGYQLTAPFESFEKLGKQSGFLFYVPAAYTSKIDPLTGFTNLFNLQDCTNAVSRKAFLMKFNSICYLAQKDTFAFEFDYSNFKTFQNSWKKNWTVFSAKERLVYQVSEKKTKPVNPTEIIKNALAAYQVNLSDGFDLLAFLKSIEPSAANARLFEDVFLAFQRTLQMRNTCAETNVDYIQSPVADKNGVCFDSNNPQPGYPDNADANGAYHIALKGLQLLLALPEKGCAAAPKFDVAEYLEFVQKRKNG